MSDQDQEEPEATAGATMRTVYLDTSVYCWIASQVDIESARFLSDAAAQLGVRVKASRLVVLELLATGDEFERAHLLFVAMQLADRSLLPDFGALVVLAATAAMCEPMTSARAESLLKSTSAAEWSALREDSQSWLVLDEASRERLQRLKLGVAILLASLRGGVEPKLTGAEGIPELKEHLSRVRARQPVDVEPTAVQQLCAAAAALILFGGVAVDSDAIEQFWRERAANDLESRLAAGPELLEAIMRLPPVAWVVDYLRYQAMHRFDGSDWIDAVHVSYMQLVDAVLTCDDAMIAYGRDEASNCVRDGRAFVEDVCRAARALALHHQAQRVEAAGDEASRCAEVHILARQLVAANRMAEAEAAFDEALELAGKLNDPKALSTILSNMAQVHRDLGDDDSAEALLHRAMPMVRARGDLHGLAIDLVQLGCIRERRDDIEGARALFNEALAQAEGLEDPVPKCAALDKIAKQRAREGELDAALAMWRGAIARLDPVRNAEMIGAMEVNMAMALLRDDGRQLDAQDVVQAAIKRLRRHGSARSLAFALATAAASAATPKQRKHVNSWLRQSIDDLIRFGSIEDAVAILERHRAMLRKPQSQGVAMQALYLCAATGCPLGLLAGAQVLEGRPPTDPIFSVLATTLTWLAREADGNPVERGVLETQAAGFLESAAHLAGVRDADEFIAWAERERLRDPRMFIPKLQQWIVSQVPVEEWLFDPNNPELRWPS